MDTTSTIHRRDFLRSASAAGLGLAMTGRFPAPARSLGGSPNERLRVAVMGLNGRGMVHARNFARLPNTELAYLCDVDARVLARAQAELQTSATAAAAAPRAIADFRRALDDRNVDVLSIAAPDHWHTPAAILAMQAGKHVYVEKPCGHDPYEGELIVQAQRKYRRVVQMGNQQRSAPRSREAIQAIAQGIIGRPYLARAWYANTRSGIGHGKPAPVPAWLDYELWQGPAPRTPYRDNVIHYNWHWFRRWGTGEICNNGTHEIDIARWALGADYPTRVSSTGGRYHFDDDWEFPDTQEVVFEFDGGRSIVWQGQSCNGLQTFGRGRGTAILGTTGSIVLDRDGYVLYDVAGKVVREVRESTSTDGLNLVGDDAATSAHMENFANAIRTDEALHSPIAEGARSVLLCHLGNIAQFTGHTLAVDPATGHVVGDAEAARYWRREYAPGWAPMV
ncbi:MAG TPA: Gfo/Idh/MocA family oxidoreductase [Gemmatimonadaceae bacterium]|nr:Gfo/Idh/MocA family oxidoreductase [Gemmatimonadaceae bacterium]